MALAAILVLLPGCGEGPTTEEDCPWRTLFQDFFSRDELLSLGLNGDECIAVDTEGDSTYGLRTFVSSHWEELASHPAFQGMREPYEFWGLARRQEQDPWVWPDRCFEIGRRVRSYPDVMALLVDSRTIEAGWCSEYDTLLVGLSRPVFLGEGRYAIFSVGITTIAAYRGKALFGASYVVIAEWRDGAWRISRLWLTAFE